MEHELSERADFNPKLGVMEEAKKLWELLCSFFFFFQAWLYYGPCCSSGEQQTGSLDCSLRQGASWFLKWDEGRGVSRGHWRGGLGGLPTHLLSAGGMHSTVLLLRALQKGLWG